MVLAQRTVGWSRATIYWHVCDPENARRQSRREAKEREAKEKDAAIHGGRLRDLGVRASWTKATVLTTFVQSALEGTPATESTEVYIAYDSDHLYFGFAVHYADPSIMRANRVDRDRAPQDDLMTIYLDTFLDQQRAYDFDVNGYGVQGDGIIDSGGGKIAGHSVQESPLPSPRPR